MTFAEDQDTALPHQRLDDAIYAIGACVPFAKGEEIFGQGEAADLVYQLVSGSVRLSCFAFGRHHTVDMVSAPGDLFGLDPNPEHAMSAEALGDCLVLVASRSVLALLLGRTELLDLLEAEPEARRH